MRIQIITKRTLANGADFQNLLNQIAAGCVTPDGLGAYVMPEEARFGLTSTGKRVGRLFPEADTMIILESSSN